MRAFGAPVPALVVGAMLMRQHGVAPAQWGMNLAAGAIALLICAIARARPSHARAGNRALIVVAAALALIAVTFIDTGISGVHRWLPIGPVTLYAAAIATPLVILGCEKRWGAWLAVIAAAMLMIQPDAAQATGLAAAIAVLAFHSTSRRDLQVACALIIALAAWSWLRPDPLEPVPHVEGILGLARQSGMVWLAAAIVSLALLPLPFFLARSSDARSAMSRALGAYLVVCILVPLVRNYPFPVLGFGISPIIGYAVALSAVSRTQGHAQNVQYAVPSA